MLGLSSQFLTTYLLVQNFWNAWNGTIDNEIEYEDSSMLWSSSLRVPTRGDSIYLIIAYFNVM